MKDQVICPRCGHTNPAGADICSQCNNPLAPTGPAETLGPKAHRGAPGSVPSDPDATIPAAGSIVGSEPLGGVPDGFEDLGEVGRGGGGIVYRARDLHLNREVAIKRLSPHLIRQGAGLTVLRREARTLATLRHPNIVLIWEFKDDPQGPYFVMEWVGGGDLDTYLSHTERFDPDDALRIIQGICRALEYAHDHGVIHRDLKPANILLTKRGEPKLVDFGLARILDMEDILRSRVVAGTVNYMAPEQARDPKNVDHRADIFALGKTIYHILTGDDPSTVYPHLLPAPIRALVMAAMAKDPEERPSNVEAIRIELERALGTQDRRIGTDTRAARQTPRQPWQPTEYADVLVRFESDPAGAMVEIDDEPLCETPATRALMPGHHTIALKKLRYVTHRASIEVREGMDPVRRTLEPNFGWLSVESVPPGLTATLDGEPLGQTPIERREVDPGTHEIAVTDERYQPTVERMRIERGETEQVSLTAVARQGAVKVTAVNGQGDAVEARVLVDGEERGRTWAPIALIVGQHEIVVDAEKRTWTGSVEIVEEQVVTVQAELTVPGARGGEHVGEETEFEIVPGAKMMFVWIPAGTFMMGSPKSEKGRSGNEGPQHEVRITKGFWLGKYEVTQGQWQAVMGSNRSHFKGSDRLPVESVSWDDTQEFIAKLEGEGYRLATEAEWEYACRAGTQTRYSFGDDEQHLGDYAWFYENSGRKTHAVGQREPNPWGLHDMHGNVWEWCADWYSEDYYASSPRKDPSGPASGSFRALRGGCWYNYARFCRSAIRSGGTPGLRSGIGFRLARTAQ